VNVLLIYPQFPDTFWSLKHALRITGRKASSPPLGLLTVAAMLPTDWGKRLVDMNVRDVADSDLAWADYALVSGMMLQRDSAKAVIARCHAAGLTVIAGGPLFTTEPGEFPEVDHLVLNEAEITLPRFLEDLAAGRPERVYTSPELADLAESPIPMWELLDPAHYVSWSLQFSRGCPNDCDFCSVTQLFGRRWRTKGTSQIIAELDRLYALGWRGQVNFVDDNLTGRKRLLREELLPALIEWRKGKWGTRFGTQATIDLADDSELMQMMVDAGFESVFIGIETLSDHTLAECGKHRNVNRHLLDDVRKILHAGLLVQGGFIVGFDEDTPSVFGNLADFIQNSGIATAMIGLLQAPNGTRLFERLKKEGRITGRMTGDNVAGLTNIIPRMNWRTLQDGYRGLMRDLYSPEMYYPRVRTLLAEYNPPRSRPRLSPWHVRAFFRSVFQLGIARRGGSGYLRLLWWTLTRKPRAFPTAVTLAISGHHFRTHAWLIPEARELQIG
jgi:radical SAM superfamily enzyme YgiQ (UPF0313 family)